MTIQDYAADAIEKSAEDLIKVAMALPEDKRDWKPLDKGRSALSQLAECAAINTLSAKVVEAAAWQDSLMAEHGPLVAALDTPEKAIDALREGTVHLVKAIRETPDSHLAHQITLPWATVSLAQMFLMPLWNMSYHEGQITYIETLA